jgi:hypothetical protein
VDGAIKILAVTAGCNLNGRASPRECIVGGMAGAA